MAYRARITSPDNSLNELGRRISNDENAYGRCHCIAYETDPARNVVIYDKAVLVPPTVGHIKVTLATDPAPSPAAVLRCEGECYVGADRVAVRVYAI